jgi:hypothetical protein
LSAGDQKAYESDRYFIFTVSVYQFSFDHTRGDSSGMRTARGLCDDSCLRDALHDRLAVDSPVEQAGCAIKSTLWSSSFFAIRLTIPELLR